MKRAPRSMNSIDSILEDKELMMTHLDLQETFPDIRCVSQMPAVGFAERFPKCHVCPKCLAALLCGLEFQKNVLAFLQELDEVGMTHWPTGNVEFPLRIDSAS